MIKNNVHKIELFLFLIAVVIVGIGVYYLGPSITSFVIKEFSYVNDLNLVITSNGNYTWQLDNIGDLKYVKLDGRVTNYGKARVYIESNGIKYLVFDSTRLNVSKEVSNESEILITGFVVSDKDKKKKNNKPVWTGVNEFIVNGTTLINLSQQFTDEDSDALIYSASEVEGLTILMNNEIATLTPITEQNFNVTTTFTASDGVDSKSHTVDLMVIAEKEISVTQPLNETNQTLNITPINQTNETVITNITINETKIITINLDYNAGTVYDANDNGEETINGVVDLTVGNSLFNWGVDTTKLCTRWEVYNVEDNKLTTFCNGNADCCAFVNLLPSKSNWSDVYYSTFGKDNSGYENIISSQVIYYDVNLSIENLKSEIYYSEWGNLSVKFFEEETAFSDACLDTCSLKGLNKSSYNLLFEIEDDAVLRIDKIKYSVLVDIRNNPPILLKNFSTINASKNKNATINLSQYFTDEDGDVLAYNYYKADNITILFENNIATVIPDKGVDGIRYTYFIANDSEGIAVSNVFMINITEEKFKPRVEINKPVKWQSKFLIDVSNLSSVNFTLPENSFNITVRILNGTIQKELSDEKIKVIEDGKVKDKEIFEVEKRLENIKKKISILEEAKLKKALKVAVDEAEFSTNEIDSKLNELYNKKLELEQQLSNKNLITANAAALTESAINETLPVLFINESLAKNTEVEISYETEAPIAIEDEINAYTKQIKIISETSYEDVLSYTAINDAPQQAIKLYWLNDGVKELFENVGYLDENGNGLIDKIQWEIPHLSNQTFEVSITILNVQSYPTVYGNWTVAFNTTGTGNLTIFAYNGTSYAEVPDDSSTINDLEYLETSCNDVILNTTIVCSNGEQMPYEVYKIKRRIAEIKKRLNELNQTG